MLKLMLLGDRTADRETMEQMVRSFPDVEWLGAHARPEDALTAAVERRPDVVIAAVELKNGNGLMFTSELQAVLPSVRVIVSARNGDFARAAYDAGAQGYLVTPASKESVQKLLGRANSIYGLRQDRSANTYHKE